MEYSNSFSLQRIAHYSVASIQFGDFEGTMFVIRQCMPQICKKGCEALQLQPGFYLFFSLPFNLFRFRTYSSDQPIYLSIASYHNMFNNEIEIFWAFLIVSWHGFRIGSGSMGYNIPNQINQRTTLSDS